MRCLRSYLTLSASLAAPCLLACGNPAATSDASTDAATVDDATPEAGDGSASTPSISGVYVPTFGQPYNPSSQFVTTVLGNPDVDGVFVFAGWDKIQPNDQNTYDWSQVDAWIDAAVAANKKVSVGVAAGSSTPSWVGTAGDYLTLTVYESAQAKCVSNVLVPIPWHASFVSAWHLFVNAFAAHLKASSTRYAAITEVKITGINGTTQETSLPHGASATYGTCVTTDTATAWNGVGYTPALVESTWSTMAADFNAAFPDKMLCTQYIAKGFPAEIIGGITQPLDTKVSAAIVASGTNAIGLARYVLEGTGLNAVGGTQPALDQYASGGGTVGYQMLYYVSGDANCVMNGGVLPCDASVLHAALARGLLPAHGSRYFEIYEQDVAAFPAEISFAHQQLPH